MTVVSKALLFNDLANVCNIFIHFGTVRQPMFMMIIFYKYRETSK